MAGLGRPSRGRVLADGHDLHRMSGGDRARAVALVEQDASTNLDLTVRDVVGLGRIPHRGRWAGVPDDPDAIEVAMRLARVSDLAERRGATPSEIGRASVRESVCPYG